MKKHLYILIVFFLCAPFALAEEPIDISGDYPTMVVNEDSTVSFCYCGAARRVSVQADFLYANEDSTWYTDHSKRIKMKKQSDGCFHATTRPISPETYTYCFRVNGKRKPDPFNPDTAWQKMHKWSVVNVGGSERADLYRTPERTGQVIHTTWFSTGENIRRRVNIYLPVGYDLNPDHKYPVLYLIHGINGYEGSWSERGRAINIMENLVAAGACEPMILVMPDVNIGIHEDRPSHHTLWNNVFNYPRLCHDHEIEKGLVELIQFVDTTYRISSVHLIAGMSDGARMAANTANAMPGYFEAVGFFSPVVHKEQLPQDSAYYSIYVGKSDMFYNNGKRFHKRMVKNETAHRYIETIGGHYWRNWRIYLSDFLRNYSK